jgi:glycyl-tRNA synthetase (class II)
MTSTRPISVWRKDGHIAEFSHFLCKSEQARGKHAIVIGD